MKKLVLLGMLLIAVNAFSQELTKVQKKEVKKINKEAQKQVDKIVDDNQLSASDKKVKVQTVKSERDSKVNDLLLSEQPSAELLIKDPIDWSDAVKDIDKRESARLKAEKKAKLSELGKQKKDLEMEKQNIKKQIDNLKKRLDAIDNQLDVVKQSRKDVSDQYK